LRKGSWHLNHGTRAALISGRRDAETTGEKIAEGAEAGEADFHANVCDGVVALGEKQFGLVEARLDAELVRSHAE
jgi:hypothetical protein